MENQKKTIEAAKPEVTAMVAEAAEARKRRQRRRRRTRQRRMTLNQHSVCDVGIAAVSTRTRSHSPLIKAHIT